MNLYFYSIIFFVLLSITNLYSQDTIYKINNEIIPCRIISIDNKNNIITYSQQTDTIEIMFKDISHIYMKEIRTYFNSSLNLMNSKKIDAKFIILDSTGINLITKKSKTKTFKYNDVFNITYNNDNEKKFFYVQDTLDESRFLTQEQMEYFIQGVRYGKKDYKNNWIYLGGFTSGVAGGYFGFVGLLVPSLYLSLIGIKEINPDLSKNENFSNPFFLDGYRQGVNNKKFRKSLIYGVVGFLTSATTFYVIERKK